MTKAHSHSRTVFGRRGAIPLATFHLSKMTPYAYFIRVNLEAATEAQLTELMGPPWGASNYEITAGPKCWAPHFVALDDKGTGRRGRVRMQVFRVAFERRDWAESI